MKPTLTFFFALLLAPLTTMQAADIIGSLPRSLPVTEGVDPAGIAKFLETMEARRFELHSFMLLRHGKVVAETWWAPYAPETPHCLYSLSKSFTSTAVGLAVSEGRLSLDDKVVSFFPESLPPQVSDHLAPPSGVAGGTSTGTQAFALEENSLGITRLTLAHTGQTVTVTAKVGDTEHSIVHGLGEWRMGDTAMPGTPTKLGAGTLATPTRKVAASAAWLDTSTLELTWRYLEFPHRDTVTCRFDADRVTLSFLSSITVLGRAAPARPTLTGKRLAP